MTQIFNQKEKTKLRQKLRRDLSKCELILWYYLRNRQIKGFKFRRQVSVENIVVDFYCPELKMVIEVDGESHYQTRDQRAKDKKRDNYLRDLGLNVLRFTNLDITKNIEGAVLKIMEFIDYLKPPLAPPS